MNFQKTQRTIRMAFYMCVMNQFRAVRYVSCVTGAPYLDIPGGITVQRAQ